MHEMKQLKLPSLHYTSESVEEAPTDGCPCHSQWMDEFQGKLSNLVIANVHSILNNIHPRLGDLQSDFSCGISRLEEASKDTEISIEALVGKSTKELQDLLEERSYDTFQFLEKHFGSLDKNLVDCTTRISLFLTRLRDLQVKLFSHSDDAKQTLSVGLDNAISSLESKLLREHRAGRDRDQQLMSLVEGVKLMQDEHKEDWRTFGVKLAEDLSCIRQSCKMLQEELRDLPAQVEERVLDHLTTGARMSYETSVDSLLREQNMHLSNIIALLETNERKTSNYIFVIVKEFVSSFSDAFWAPVHDFSFMLHHSITVMRSSWGKLYDSCLSVRLSLTYWFLATCHNFLALMLEKPVLAVFVAFNFILVYSFLDASSADDDDYNSFLLRHSRSYTN